MLLSIFKKCVHYLIRLSGFEAIFSLTRNGSALVENGWFRSFKEKKSIDKNGDPIPWMTYPFIRYIESNLDKDVNVFEYGCGNSTLWWAKRTRKVVACEHDPTWCKEIENQAPLNVSLYCVALSPNSAYSEFIASYKKEFDVIVVDGRDRVACVKNAVEALTEKGVIIWDNSDRPEYDEGYSFLLDSGFRRLDFFGMGPINNYEWCTSVFYKSSNILGI